MFLGTTPSIISQFLIGEIKRIKPAKVFVPFAGNFVIEQLCGVYDRDIEVMCSDVSLYSRAIGHWLDGRGSEIRLTEETLEKFPALRKYEEPFRSAIAVLFLGEVAVAETKPHILFYQNILKDAKANQDKYCSDIATKLKKFKSNLGNRFHFFGSDGCKLFTQAKPGDLVYYDPPFWTGGYEKMFKELESYFYFETPEYTQMTDDVKMDNLHWFLENDVAVFYRAGEYKTNDSEVEIPSDYKMVFRYKYRNDASYCLYTNKPGPTFVGKFTPLREEAMNLPIISREHKITSKTKIQVVHIKSNVANHYRLMWVKKVAMKNAGESYLVFADEKVIGVIVLMSGMHFGNELALIVSDPSAPTSQYKRLSKLILYIACTQQMLDIFNEKVMWEHTGFTTAVYTNAPVSMKYRSLFTLHERKKDTSGNTANVLIYQNRSQIFPTFQDALKAWLQKDAKATR